MAAQLGRNPDYRVELVPGGIGELRVSVDGRDVARTRRWWFATPADLVARVRARMCGG